MDTHTTSFNYQNFAQLSKLIEQNKIQVNLVESTTKKQIQRKRQTFKYPASIGGARIHQKATKFGFLKDLQGQIPIVCPCCMFRIDSQPISLCYGTTQKTIELENNFQQYKLPPGIAVLFSFLKASIVYILLLVLLTGFYIYTTVISKIMTNCSSQCNFIEQLVTCKDKLIETNIVINGLFIGSIIIAFIFFLIYRKNKNAWHKFIYSKNLSQDAYTIMISNIPILDFPKPGQKTSTSNQFYYRKHLENYLQSKITEWAQNSDHWTNIADTNEGDFKDMIQKNGGELKSNNIVKSISLCYNLHRLQILDQTTDELMNQHIKLQEDDNQLIQQVNDKNTDRFSTIPKKVDFINDCSVVLCKQYASDSSFLFNMTHFVGHAFVSFQFQHYKTFFLNQYYKNSKAFIYNGAPLKIVPGTHPKDINWKNLRFSNAEKSRKKLNSIFILILISITLSIVLFLLNLLLFSPYTSIDFQFANQPYVFGIVSALLIMLANKIFAIVIKSLVRQENHKTKVNETTSFIFKYVVITFVNSCLQYYLINLLKNNHDNLTVYGNIYITISSIIQLLIQLIHPQQIIKSLKLWFKYRKSKNEDKINKFQLQLNKQFQYTDYNISVRYGYYLQKIYVAAFFAYSAPLGLIVTLITFILMFWIDKINLFYRSALLYSGNISISNFVLRMMQFSLLIFSFSFFIFQYQQSKTFNLLTFVGLCLALIYVIFIIMAPAGLERAVFGRDEASDKYMYDDCIAEGKFLETYWTQNPATFLIDEKSVTGKAVVTNPATLRQFALTENNST